MQGHEVFVGLVNNVGFPIAVCIALFYQNMKTNEAYQELQKIVYQNTVATQNLVSLINGVKKDV